MEQCSSDFELVNSRFMQWLSAVPDVKLSSKIALHDYSHEGGGRGVVAVDDIDADEVLFSIPRTLLLSYSTSSLKQRTGTDASEMADWDLLILVLLYETSQPSSPWAPYLAMFPVTFTTPMFWGDSELHELQGSPLLEKIGREEADARYHDTILPYITKHQDLFDLQRCTLQHYHRIGSIIMAYSFDSSSRLNHHDASDDEGDDCSSSTDSEAFEKVMCPLADLLNADINLNNARLFHHESSLDMCATRAIKRGDQIYNTYGDLPNADLLRRYGYVQADNTYNVAEIPADLITSLVPALDGPEERRDRIDWLLDMELLDDVYELDASGKVPKAMLITLELLLLPHAEFEAVKSEDAALPKGQKHSHLQMLVLRALTQYNARYNTSIQQDEALLSNGSADLSYNTRNAILVRLDEKRIIQKTHDTVSAWALEADKKRALHDGALPNKKRGKNT